MNFHGEEVNEHVRRYEMMHRAGVQPRPHTNAERKAHQIVFSKHGPVKMSGHSGPYFVRPVKMVRIMN